MNLTSRASAAVCRKPRRMLAGCPLSRTAGGPYFNIECNCSGVFLIRRVASEAEKEADPTLASSHAFNPDDNRLN
jgi:hypothetical protein